MRIRDQWALPFPPQKFSPSVSVCGEEKEESLQMHIYIYYTLYTLFGPLDLIGQSSELGEPIKNQAIICVKSHYGPQYKN